MEISELKEQKEPMNAGCNYGNDMLRHSIKKHGLTRSIVADKNNIVFVGDKVFRMAKELGIKKVHVIETTGDTLVVVKRTDVDADSVKGKEIALVDNLTTEENLEWDAENVTKAANTHFGFNPLEWGGDACVVREIRIEDLLKEDVTRVTDKKDKPFVAIQQQSLFE